MRLCPIIIILCLLGRPASPFAPGIQHTHRNHPPATSRLYNQIQEEDQIQTSPNATSTSTEIEHENENEIKACYYQAPDGKWNERLQLQNLTVGQHLIGTKIPNTDLLQAKTGPKIFFECGVGRIDTRNNKWQMVSGMLRLGRASAKPSAIRKKVARMSGSGKMIDLYVKKIDLHSFRLEVTRSLDEIQEIQERNERLRRGEVQPMIPASTLKEGMELVGTVVKLQPYGCMVDVGANRRGLLHIQKVADLFGKYIDKEKGLGEVGLEHGATIKVSVLSNEKKRLFLDFTQETKDLALAEAEEAEALKSRQEEEERKKQEDEEERKQQEEALKALNVDAEEEEEEEEKGSDVSVNEASMWAAYADDYAGGGYDDDGDNYDEDADIEDSLGIGSY